MKITRGKIPHAKRILIYGPEGIGKTTFASQFPAPIFIDTENGTKNLDVARFDKPTSWAMLKKEVEYAINERPCKTLVIDTFDAAETLCIDELLAEHEKKGIEDFNYGNGYVYEKEDVSRFLMLLDRVIDAGVNVVIAAHAQLRKFEQPDELGAYDRWELKLGKKTSSQISPLLKEWADMVLFVNYKTFSVAVDDKGKKHKAQGGRRVMYTSHHPCWDAKNRYGLPEELPFEYDAIKHIIEGGITNNVPAPCKAVEHADFAEIIDEPEETAESPTNYMPENETPSEGNSDANNGIPQRLLDLMNADGVTEAEIRRTVFDRGHYPEDTPISNYDENFIDGWIIAHWSNVTSYVKTNLR